MPGLRKTKPLTPALSRWERERGCSNLTALLATACPLLGELPDSHISSGCRKAADFLDTLRLSPRPRRVAPQSRGPSRRLARRIDGPRICAALPLVRGDNLASFKTSAAIVRTSVVEMCACRSLGGEEVSMTPAPYLGPLCTKGKTWVQPMRSVIKRMMKTSRSAPIMAATALWPAGSWSM